MVKPGRLGVLIALCAAVLLLAAGMGLGRYATLRQGAVLRAGGGPVALAPLAVAEGSADEAGPGGWQVDINRASAPALAELPGIGPAIAGRIVDYREQNGAFESPEEIMAVRGIGESLYSRIRDYITLGPQPAAE